MDHRMLAAARGGIFPCLRYVNLPGSTLVHGFRPGLRFRVKRLRVLGGLAGFISLLAILRRLTNV